MNYKALDRRVKRHIIAGEHQIFTACQPGLEEAAERELSSLGFSPEREKEPGSLVFKGRVEDLWKAALMARSISRIALRLDGFKADGFRELKQKFGRIPWELYLREGAPCRVRISTKHCRIHVHDKIAKALQHSLVECFAALEGQAPRIGDDHNEDQRNDPSVQTLMIRGVDDRFTVSLDAGGGALYERGYKPYVNEAPLRETTAAALLILAGLERAQEDAPSGTTERSTVLDAMCGSGTFALEALGLSAGLPASPTRVYPFAFWPSFRPGRFEFMKKEILKHAGTPCRIMMSDTDEKSLDAARGNLKLFRQQYGLETDNEEPDAVIRKADFFKGPARNAAEDGSSMLILNPPYGLRLPLEDKLAFFRRLGQRIGKDYKGCRWGIIAPGLDCEKALGLHWEKKYLFRNGGFPVSFLVGKS